MEKHCTNWKGNFGYKIWGNVIKIMKCTDYDVTNNITQRFQGLKINVIKSLNKRGSTKSIKTILIWRLNGISIKST